MFTFETGSPSANWGFNIGDIDAETIGISGTTAAGIPATAAQLGVQTPYNYCDASPRSSACSGLPASGNDIPQVTIGGSDISIEDAACPTDATRCNTTGESAWFMPTVSLASITITSGWKIGIPSAQLWFATSTTSIAGTVDTQCAAPLPSSVDLLAPDSALLATAPVDTEGAFSFAPATRRSDYTVRPTPSALPADTVGTSAAVDAIGVDPVVGIAVNVTPAFIVSGSLAGDGTAAASRTVNLAGQGISLTTTSNADGSYAFAQVLPGRYTVTVTLPPNVSVSPASQTRAVECSAISLDPFRITLDPRNPIVPELAATGGEVSLPLMWTASLSCVLGIALVGIGQTRRKRSHRLSSSN